MMYVKVYRLTLLGVCWTHTLIGSMIVTEDNGRVTQDARDIFCSPGEDREHIQVGNFYRAYKTKEVS